MIKKVTTYLLMGCLSLIGCLLISCDDNDSDSPSQLVVNRFYPTSGGVGTEILITGKNFTDDISKIEVTVGEKVLPIINANTSGIMVVVPKKLGSGPLRVKIGDNTITSVENFTYIFSATVTTLAGNGKAGYADGEGLDAQFTLHDTDTPWRKGSICVDDNLNIYVGDVGNTCLRKITPEGMVSTLAGRAGSSDHIDGIGNAARFKEFYGMDCDAEGNIFLTDVAEWSIRKVTPEGEVTTLEHTGFEPWCLAVDKRDGTLYITNPNATGGVWQRKPDGTTTHIIIGVAISGIAVDANGNLYTAEFNNSLIAKYDAGTWNRSVIAGSEYGYEDGITTVAKFAYPWGIALDSNGDIYIAGNGAWDGGNNPDQSIRMIDMENHVVRTVAGSSATGYINANGTSAAFNAPLDLTVDKNGIIYVFDRKNNVIRKILYE